MVQLESDGRLTFELEAPEATTVELLGAFRGWHPERIPMNRQSDGRWTVVIEVPPGDFLFRYVVDGEHEVIDDHAHGTRFDADGRPWSRAWRPDWSWAEAGVLATIVADRAVSEDAGPDARPRAA
ncbi:MAG: hypothetical protein AB8G96_00140 [Phycisphaerales bacterium]